MPMITPGYFIAMSAVGFGSMSSRFCSIGPPPMPLPTILRNASTRVLDAIDHVVFEIGEIAPAGAARVRHGGHAAAEREAIGIDAVVARIGAARARSGVDVHVDVDETRRDVQPFNIDYLAGLVCCNGGCDVGNLMIFDRNVPDGIDVVLRIDHVAVLEKKIVRGLRYEWSGAKKQKGGAHSRVVYSRPA